MRPDCIDITIAKDTGPMKRNMILKTKEVSERSIVMKVKNRVKENSAVETEKKNKTDKPLSPDLLRKMNAYWRAV